MFNGERKGGAYALAKKEKGKHTEITKWCGSEQDKRGKYSYEKVDQRRCGGC